MTPQQARAGHLTAIAQPPSPAPAFGDLAAWATWNVHTLAGEAVCDLGEWAMKRKHRQPGRLTRAAHRAWHAWPAFLARFYARETWRGLPGPWPVKVALCAVCLAIPGPQDEILLIAVTQVLRARHARKASTR